MKPSTIDEYIALAKADIYVYLMMTVIIFSFFYILVTE